MPMKHIRKGISKRGSMTRAYSAGANKIADNMYFDCRVEDYHRMYGITKPICKKLSKLLIEAIKQVCPGPLSTMSYLQDLATFQLGKFEVKGPGDAKDLKGLKKRRLALLSVEDPSDEELHELNDTVKTIKEFSYELVDGNGEKTISWKTPSGFQAHYKTAKHTQHTCLLYTSPSPRDRQKSRMPSSA